MKLDESNDHIFHLNIFSEVSEKHEKDHINWKSTLNDDNACLFNIRNLKTLNWYRKISALNPPFQT